MGQDNINVLCSLEVLYGLPREENKHGKARTSPPLTKKQNFPWGWKNCSWEKRE